MHNLTGAALGHPVLIFMPDWLSDERKNLIQSLGATIRLFALEPANSPSHPT